MQWAAMKGSSFVTCCNGAIKIISVLIQVVMGTCSSGQWYSCSFEMKKWMRMMMVANSDSIPIHKAIWIFFDKSCGWTVSPLLLCLALFFPFIPFVGKRFFVRPRPCLLVCVEKTALWKTENLLLDVWRNFWRTHHWSSLQTTFLSIITLATLQ